jgi:hypothetical protein
MSYVLPYSFPVTASYTLEFPILCIVFYVSYFVLKPVLLVDLLNIIRHNENFYQCSKERKFSKIETPEMQLSLGGLENFRFTAFFQTSYCNIF